RRPPRASTLFPYTTLFRSRRGGRAGHAARGPPGAVARRRLPHGAVRARASRHPGPRRQRRRHRRRPPGRRRPCRRGHALNAMLEIAPDVYHLALMPFSSVNAYFADGVLFDAGVRGSAQKIRRALAGRTVQTHALTHAHPDHQGASHAICEAFGLPLWVGARDADVVEGTEPMAMPDYPLARLTARAWMGPPHPVARRLAEGDAVGRFTVIETPGHTPGHVAFWDEKARVLVLGDVLRNISYVTLRRGLREPPAAFTPDPAQNRASARKLLGLRPSLVL